MFKNMYTEFVHNHKDSYMNYEVLGGQLSKEILINKQNHAKGYIQDLGER